MRFILISLLLAQTHDFEKGEPGKPPAGFTAALSGKGAPGAWEIRADGPQKVLAQTTSDPARQRYPLLILDGLEARDAAVSVRFKPLSGEIDQAGGVVLRYRDPDHYYVARANVLEDNVRFYKMEGGKRTQLGGLDVKVAPGEWHTLALEAKGKSFTVTFDGTTAFTVDDETFKDAGRTGLWTKADSVTLFDDFAVRVN